MLPTSPELLLEARQPRKRRLALGHAPLLVTRRIVRRIQHTNTKESKVSDQQVPDHTPVFVGISIHVEELHQLNPRASSTVTFSVTNNVASVLQTYVGQKMRKVYMGVLNEWREKWLAANEAKPYFEEGEAEVWTAKLLAKVRKVVEEGLHPVYKNDLRAWAIDFFAGDWPWNEEARATIRELFEADPTYPELQRQFQEKYGCDLFEA